MPPQPCTSVGPGELRIDLQQVRADEGAHVGGNAAGVAFAAAEHQSPVRGLAPVADDEAAVGGGLAARHDCFAHRPERLGHHHEAVDADHAAAGLLLEAPRSARRSPRSPARRGSLRGRLHDRSGGKRQSPACSRGSSRHGRPRRARGRARSGRGRGGRRRYRRMPPKNRSEPSAAIVAALSSRPT